MSQMTTTSSTPQHIVIDDDPPEVDTPAAQDAQPRASSPRLVARKRNRSAFEGQDAVTACSVECKAAGGAQTRGKTGLVLALVDISLWAA